MDSEQLSIPIAPAGEPGAVDDLYEAAWELLAETIRKNAKHKSARDILGDYLPDTRSDGRGASTPDALSFVFLSPASACDVQMAVTAHWFELAAAVAAPELAALCKANGFELRAPEQTALDLANAARERPFVPGGEAIVGVVRGEAPAIVTDDGGETPLEEAELSAAAKKLARAANESGVCACPFCDAVRKDKAVAPKPKKAKREKALKLGELPPLEHFTSMAKAVKSPDRVGTIEVPDKGHAENVIPPDIGKLHRLTSLVINGYATRIPQSLFELRQLETLFVHTPEFSMPDALGELTKLKRLGFSGINVPETIGRLTELEYLSLRYSKAGVLPEAVTTLSKLTDLELADLVGIWDPLPNLGLLTSLRRLTISSTAGSFGATVTPLDFERVDFSGLKSLVSLKLGIVTKFPATLRDMPALELLKIAALAGDWPEVFDTFPALNSLEVDKSELAAWPRTLNDLPKLKTISISSSKLVSLDGLRALPALESLRVGGSLERLPEAAPHLPALRGLDLTYTKLTHLPPWVMELPSLASVSLPHGKVPREEIDALKAKKPDLYVWG